MKRRIFLLVLILSLGLSTMSGTVRQVPDEGEIIPVKFKPKRTIDDKKNAGGGTGGWNGNTGGAQWNGVQ